MAKKKTATMEAVPLETVIKDLQKRYGDNVIRKASDTYFYIKRIPTGILALDRLLGGGIALGRFTEFFGEYSALKSYSATAAVAAFQREFPDKICVWVDAEGSLDPNFLEYLGVDTARLQVVPRPEHGEEVTSLIADLMKTRKVSCFVVDSITALMPIRETEYEAEDTTKAMGASGKMTSAMMRRLTAANVDNSALILINQVRDQIGMIFGDPSKPTGGRAIPFFAGQRVDFRRGENIRVEVERLGAGGKNVKTRKVSSRVINLRMEKDKTAPREGEVESLVWIPSEKRIDEEESILVLGIEDGLVTRNAQSITFYPKSKKRKQNVKGWGAAKAELSRNEKLRNRLTKSIQERSTELGYSGPTAA